MTRALVRTQRRQAGFTLIEMLIVLLLVAILTSIAVPGYHRHIRQAHRAEARVALLQAAQRLEREATATGAYPDTGLPEALTTVPSGSYRIARQPSADAFEAATRFTLTATPIGAQSADDCGTFTLSNTGERGLAGNRAKPADCWRR